MYSKDICLAESHPNLVQYLCDPSDAYLYKHNSTKSVLWRCARGHEVLLPVRRVTRSTLLVSPWHFPCGVCNNSIVLVGFNSLWDTHKDISRRLQNPDDGYSVTYGSTKALTWVCPVDSTHVYESSPKVMVRAFGSKFSGCRICSSRSAVPGINSLWDTEPEIALQLLDQTVGYQVTRGSSKIHYFVCTKNPAHIWPTEVRMRLKRNQNCPRCSLDKTSRPEILLRSLASDVCEITVLPRKLMIPWRSNNFMYVDLCFSVGGKTYIIEYDGAYWHNRQEALLRDIDKSVAILDRNIILCRVRESTHQINLGNLPLDHCNLRQYTVKSSTDFHHVSDVFEQIINEILTF